MNSRNKHNIVKQLWGFPGGVSGENPTRNAGDIRNSASIPGLGRSLKEGMATTPVFLPGESHGQTSPLGYGPQGHKESDMTKLT